MLDTLIQKKSSLTLLASARREQRLKAIEFTSGNKINEPIIHIRTEQFMAHGETSKRKMRFLDINGNLVRAYYTYAMPVSAWDGFNDDNPYGFNIINIPTELEFSYSLSSDETNNFVMYDFTPAPSLMAGVIPWIVMPESLSLEYWTECIHFDREVIQVIGVPT